VRRKLGKVAQVTMDETEAAFGARAELRRRAPPPTREFRDRAWHAFQAALDSYLAGRGAALRRPR